MADRLQELVPVGEVDDLVLREPQAIELLVAALGAHVAGFEVLTAEDVVHVLQSPPSERKPDAGPKELVRARIDEGVLRRRTGHLRIDGLASEFLELTPTLLPVHRHEREDEVRLVELDSFGVGADEDLGNLLLARCHSKLDHLKTKVAQVPNSVDALLKNVLLVVIERLASRLAQPVDELSEGRLVPGVPQRGDVGDELRAALDGGVSHLERLV